MNARDHGETPKQDALAENSAVFEIDATHLPNAGKQSKSAPSETAYVPPYVPADRDPARFIEAWPTLSDPILAAMLALLQSATDTPPANAPVVLGRGRGDEGIHGLWPEVGITPEATWSERKAYRPGRRNVRTHAARFIRSWATVNVAGGSFSISAQASLRFITRITLSDSRIPSSRSGTGVVGWHPVDDPSSPGGCSPHLNRRDRNGLPRPG